MSFLSSAIGGTLFGGVLSIVQRVVDYKAKAAEAKIEIEKAKALSELKVKEGELAAFTQSLKQEGEEAYDPDPLPANAPAWACWIRAIVDCIAVLVDAFRKATRPGLTWFLAGGLLWLLSSGKVPDYMLAGILADFVFTVSTALTWWFGSRPRSAK